MKPLNGRFIGQFDESHQRVIKIGNVELVRAEMWEAKQGDKDKHTTFEENFNYLETKPQIAVVTHSNADYPFLPGDKVFLHYMAYETAKYADEATKEAFILGEYVFFTFMPDGTWKMAENYYLGKLIYEKEQKTKSGIIINWNDRPVANQIEITHAWEGGDYKPGETVLTIDNYQYVFKHEGQEYVMLRDREIVARV